MIIVPPRAAQGEPAADQLIPTEPRKGAGEVLRKHAPAIGRSRRASGTSAGLGARGTSWKAWAARIAAMRRAITSALVGGLLAPCLADAAPAATIEVVAAGSNTPPCIQARGQADSGEGFRGRHGPGLRAGPLARDQRLPHPGPGGCAAPPGRGHRRAGPHLLPFGGRAGRARRLRRGGRPHGAGQRRGEARRGGRFARVLAEGAHGRPGRASARRAGQRPARNSAEGVGAQRRAREPSGPTARRRAPSIGAISTSTSPRTRWMTS